MIKLFNDEHFAPSKTKQSSEFHQFSRLPLEIRLCIWFLSLEQRRFIPLRVSTPHYNITPSHGYQPQFYSSQNQLGRTISGRHYKLSIHAAESVIASPLFSTTTESRFAALEFYRLRLPLARGQIRISPEYDVIFLQGRDRLTGNFDDILADILHDIRAYDPKDEGVKHLALTATELSHSLRDRGSAIPSFVIRYSSSVGVLDDFNATTHLPQLNANELAAFYSSASKDEINVKETNTSLNQGPSAPDVSGGTSRHHPPPHPIAISSLVDILSTKLQSLWCIEQLLAKRKVHAPIPADIIFGAKSPLLVETCPLLPPIAKLGRVCMNFDYIENDPRYVEQDLKTLTFSQDPRRLYASWRVFEKSLGVRRAGPFRFSICIAKEMEPLEEWEPDAIEGHVSTKLGIHQMVHRNRQFEMDDWEHAIKFKPKGSGPDKWGSPRRGYRPKEEKEKNMQLVEKATTTIGMWVFPHEAFEKGNSHIRYGRHKQVFQASVAPGLVVFDI